MESARIVFAYPGRERKFLRRELLVKMEMRHILKRQVHLEKRQKMYIISSKCT